MAVQKQKNINRGVKIYSRIIFAFIFVCILMIVFCLQYYKTLYSTIQTETKTYLQEIARRIGSNIDRILDDNFAILYTIASIFETQDINSITDIQKTLKKQQSYWNYENIFLVDDTANLHQLDGGNKTVFLNTDTSIRESILNGKTSMSTTQIVNNREYIFFSVPLTPTVIDGKKMVALAASYNPSSFAQVLSMHSFNEQAYSQIVSRSGTTITRPASPFAVKTGYNVFISIQKAKFDDGSSLSDMEKNIENNRSGQIGFTLDDTHWYMVYVPVYSNDWYVLTFVPAHVVSQKSDMLLKMTIVICLLIACTFSALIVTLMYTFRNHKNKLEHIAYVDDVTGGNTIQRFYECVQKILNEAQEGEFVLVYTNLEKFKVLNELHGRKHCDILLRTFYEHINRTFSPRECMGRLTADNFCILLEYTSEEQLAERFISWYTNADQYVQNNTIPWGLPITEFGVYIITDKTLPLPQMIDRAKLSLKESSRSIDNKLRYAFYDDTVRQRLFREKYLEDMMVSSLKNREFRVYLQPKYHLPDETIGGAEALIRWQNEKEGMIFPNEFIPLFEKNGFIIQTDLWVFEEVCRTIRGWLDAGLTPIKISVNCSRMHFKDPLFLVPYKKLAAQYGIDKKYLEIELTESVVFENTEQLIKIIEEIKTAGFGCSMDDFGSGYSSLNLIQSIPVDTLKLDKIFFHGHNAKCDRTEAVVKNIVSMAQALSMETVAEGIEDRDQVEMLKNTGCDYIQGYVFAKPMTISSFEQLTFGKEIT